MTGKVYQTEDLLTPDNKAAMVANMWDSWNSQRAGWLAEKRELRNYIFATDTTKTSNSALPWKNSTTLPKLTQIRDNLHANYMSALFPNDNWLRWEGYSQDAVIAQKRDTIIAYMQNKARESKITEVVSQLIYDYIDYGNAFADVIFVNETKRDVVTGEEIPQYVGPRLVRIHPFDIVFNPLASSFRSSPKIVRSLKNIGEFKKDAKEQPNNIYLQEAVSKMEQLRRKASSTAKEDTDKFQDIMMDGFGSYQEYLRSGVVEVLEFEGDYYNHDTMELEQNKVITVVDRSIVIRDEELPGWLGSTKVHVGWRTRPENLWAMGPLDNLVGMQYRIDHLENLKADVFDLIAYPPLKIRGEVEDFVWAPMAEIHIDEGGDVEFLAPPAQALQADNQIALLEARMEEYAGAPKQALGIRTPGEKTAFEVQTLENNAGRIFQHKINHFEINLLEPALNFMLEVARRELNIPDTLRVMDDDLGFVKFMNITREDITGAGKLRPVGSRHFAARAQLLQNLQQLFNSPIGQIIGPNVSSKELTKLVEDILQLNRFSLFQDNVALYEQQERAMLQNQLQEDAFVQQTQPVMG